MNRIELAKKMAAVKDLMGLVEMYRTGDTSRWVELGLFTATEYAEWRRVTDLHSKMYQAGRDAESAIQFVAPRDQYPKDYLKIIDRIAELEADVLIAKDIRNIMRNLAPFKFNQYTNGGSTGAELGVQNNAQRAFDALEASTTAEIEEYEDLKATEERRSHREGTVVGRINQGVWNDTQHRQRIARDNAIEEFRKAHSVDLARGEELDNLRESRRDDKLEELGKAINAVIEKALEETK